jgi:hypothetical protein
MTGFSYPHPVLGNDDDVVGTWDPKLDSVTLERTRITLELSDLIPANATISKLIAAKTAHVVLRIQCARTHYREVVKTTNSSLIHTLRADDVEDNVEIVASVCAATKLPGYAPAGMHSDYPPAGFDLAPGHVLAVANRFIFSADKDFDPLRAPIPSLFLVRQSGAADGPFEVDWGADKIEIALSDQQWSQFLYYRDVAPHYIHAALVLPVLGLAITKMESENTKWTDRLQMLLLEREIDESDPCRAAQELLADPFGRSSEQLYLRLAAVEDD